MNILGIFDKAMLNTESCILVLTLCRFNFTKQKKTLSKIGFVNEMKNTQSKFAEIYVGKIATSYNVAIKHSD
jgi:hypothetical protein